jgi:hypothetical protein
METRVTHGELRNAKEILVRKPQGKKPLGRTRSIWKYYNKIYLRETGCGYPLKPRLIFMLHIWHIIPYCKGKAVPLHAMEAIGGRGGISPTHSRPRH